MRTAVTIAQTKKGECRVLSLPDTPILEQRQNFKQLQRDNGELDGEQFVSSSEPIGVIVGGMDWATSYGYAGGLSFTRIWEPPTVPPG